MILPLTGEWQYQLKESESTDGNVVVPAIVRHRGEIIFRRTFTLDDSWKGRNIYLHIEGILSQSIIRINNEYLHTLNDPYSPNDLTIPADRLLFNQENILEIQVSNLIDFESSIPTGDQFGLWAIDNGIFREIYLAASDIIHIESFSTDQTFADNYRRAQLWVKSNLRRAGDLQYQQEPDQNNSYFLELALFRDSVMIGYKQAFNFSFDDGNVIEQTLSLTINNVKLWTPDNPQLYRLRLSLKDAKSRKLIDRQSHTIGFYDFEIRGNKFQLNGRPFTIQGIDYPQYFPEIGEMFIWPVAQKDLLQIKSTGANTIMTGGRPVPEMFLELCDEVGIFVLQEFPVYFIPGDRLVENDFLEKSGRRFQSMVIAGRNHPSVLAWGIGRNFDTASPAASTYLSNIKTKIRNLDKRPLFVTTNLLHWDKLGYALDFTVIDALTWRNEKNYIKNINNLRNRYPGKPILLGGIGRIVEPGNNNGTLDPLSEESQALFLDHNLRIAQTTQVFSGYIVQSFTDYLTEKSNNFGILKGHKNYMPLGIYDMERKERAAVKAVRSFYLNENKITLRSGNEPTSIGFLFIAPALVNLLLFGWTYKNSLRFRENVKRSLAHPFGFFSDIRDRRIIPLSQSVWLASFISVSGAIFYAAILYHSRISILFEYFSSVFFTEGLVRRSLIYITWHPFAGLVVILLLILGYFTLNGILIRFLSIFTRVRINFRQCLSLSYWSGTNFIFVIPLTVLFFILLGDPQIFFWIGLIWIFLHFWFLFRLINGTRVLLDVQFINIVFVFLFIAILVLTIFLLYMQNANNFLDYYSLLNNIISVHRW